MPSLQGRTASHPDRRPADVAGESHSRSRRQDRPSAGRLRSDLAALGLAIATRPAVRRQVRAEIRAQFEAFRATGLALDHVNAHRHYHLHPTILSEILAIGADYGARALRTPVEPLAGSAARWSRRPGRRSRSSDGAMGGGDAAAGPQGRLGSRADRVFGLAWSGAMTEPRLAGLIRNLPAGAARKSTLHPATAADSTARPGATPIADELAALLSAQCAAARRSSARARARRLRRLHRRRSAIGGET